MTIHYHGTPITPRSVLTELAGRNFCVSYGHRNEVQWCHDHGQSVMLDNGAFSYWQAGSHVQGGGLDGYYHWVEAVAGLPHHLGGHPRCDRRQRRRRRPCFTKWPQRADQGRPGVAYARIPGTAQRLANGYERICIGSSEQYATLQLHSGIDGWRGLQPRWQANGPPGAGSTCFGAWRSLAARTPSPPWIQPISPGTTSRPEHRPEDG